MTELAALESDQIGRLDWDSTSGMHRIVLFPDSSALVVDVQGYKESDAQAHAGPFENSLFIIHVLLVHQTTSLRLTHASSTSTIHFCSH